MVVVLSTASLNHNEIFLTWFLFVTNTRKSVFAKVIITVLVGTTHPQEKPADFAF